jgi:protein-tyrosine phosphatase
MTRLCFVCLGNVCRSPTAQAVFEKLAAEQGRAGEFECDSRGVGVRPGNEEPDPRAQRAANKHGVSLTGRSTPFLAEDFDGFDLVLAMDEAVAESLRAMCRDGEERSRVRLLRSYAPPPNQGADIPDPWFGGEDGFDRAFDLCRYSCRGLLESLR